jgi:tRNA pseudouridine38-40 synthase
MESEKLRRIMLTIAYDGTNYCGFQVQPNGKTVQETVNRALSDLLKTDVRTIGASRTDAGVHARGNVAIFDTTARMAGDKFAFALNTYLPDDIKIQGSREVPPEFHPRYTDTIKTYEYKILNRVFPDPTRRIDSLHWYGPLDLPAMQKAASYLVGEHDFLSFAASGFSASSTVRNILSASVTKADDLIRFRITGNGFLYNMVRIIAGTLIEIGKGDRSCDSIPEILSARDREQAGATAPAHGLTLMEIRYPKWEKIFREQDQAK